MRTDRTERLLAGLQLEAEEKMYLDRRREAMQPKPVSRTSANNAKIRHLRSKTQEMEYELDTNRRLEAETKKNFAATMKLRESRLTAAERRLRAVETRRGQLLYSRVIPELHPDWRRQAQEEFFAKKL
jgi:hypothetical protein